MQPKTLKCLCAQIHYGFHRSGAHSCLLRASKEQEAVAQSRCLVLTGLDIYAYTNAKPQRNAITCLTLQLGNKIVAQLLLYWQYVEYYDK